MFGNSQAHARRDGNEPARSLDLLAGQIMSLTLTRVHDVFDADGLWSPQHTKKSAIREKVSGSPRRRLHAHLKANKHKIPRRDPGTGRLLKLGCVYTDVVVQINPHVWMGEIRSGEPGFAILTTNLALRHREDFKRDLKEAGRAPRYVVAPAADLTEDEVRFLFGTGIFVPDENDTLLARVSLLDAAGKRLELLDWEIYDSSGAVLRRPMGLYAEQRSCFIRGPAGPPPIPLVARDWPRGNTGFVQLSHPPAAKHWRAYDDGEATRCQDEDGKPHAGGRRYRFLGSDGQEAISLLLEPLGAGPGVTDAVPTASAPVGGSTEQPLFVLRLVGIALPRIGGSRQVRLREGVSLDSWRLWLDATGRLATQSTADPSTLAMLTGEAESGRLLARHAGSTELVEIARLPFQLQTNPSRSADNATVSGPIHDNYVGLVWLPQPEELALSYADHPVPGPLWIGRGGGQPAPDLCLDFLDQPSSLLWSRPGVTGRSLGQLGLSRRQLQAVLSPLLNRLEVTPPEHGSPVPSLVLDAELGLLTTLTPGDATWHLELDQYLLLGCYLLRFELIGSDTAVSDEATIFAPPAPAVDNDRTVVAPGTVQAGERAP
jgi:hypothetical protein